MKHEYQRNGKSITSIGLDDFADIMDRQREDLHLFPELAKRCGRTPVLMTSRYEEFQSQYEINTDYFYLYDPKRQSIEIEVTSDDMPVIADEAFLKLTEHEQVEIMKTAKELTELMLTNPQHYFHEIGSNTITPGDVVKRYLKESLKDIGRREWLEALAIASDVFNSAITMWTKLYGTLIVPESTASFRQMLVIVSEVFKDIKIKQIKPTKKQFKYRKRYMKVR